MAFHFELESGNVLLNFEFVDVFAFDFEFLTFVGDNLFEFEEHFDCDRQQGHHDLEDAPTEENVGFGFVEEHKNFETRGTERTLLFGDVEKPISKVYESKQYPDTFTQNFPYKLTNVELFSSF